MTEAATEVAAAEHLSLTPAEQAYLNSKGEVTEGLNQKPSTPSDQAEASQPQEVLADQVIEDPDAEPEQPLKEGEDGNKGRFVRHGAFHKERTLRKQYESELAQYKEKFARVDERLRLINEAMSSRAEQAEQPKPPPDPQADPFGYMQWQSERIESLEKRVTEPIKVAEEVRAESRMKDAYIADARRFAQQTPDFGPAYTFLMNGRDKELQAYGISDAAERMSMIAAEEQSLVSRAIHDNVSPSERLYRLAEARGYVKSAPQKQDTQVSSAKPSAAEKIEQINKAQAAAKSLSNIGGAPGSDLTAASLAEMPAEDFERVVGKLSSSKLRELFGG